MASILYPFLLAFAVCLVIGPSTIKIIRKLKFGQQVREDGPASHLKKQNVPTMGGIMIIIALIVCALVFGFSSSTLIAFVATLGYALIGFLDDFIKIIKKRSLGLKAYQKIIGQIGIAVIMALYAYNNPNIGSKIVIPFVGEAELGWTFVPFAIIVILAIVNAVNLIDGLDGLASRTTGLQTATFAIIITLLAVSEETKELSLFAAASAGACLGFLCFNTYPARIFMGDTGALGLGGALALIGLFSRFAILLPVMGIMLVATCISVILQVGSYKLRHGKRIFKMAPLHHHYELLGYHETTVTAIYTVITLVACLVSIALALEFPKI